MRRQIQYCAKEMQMKFGVFRSLFSRQFDEILHKKFHQSASEFLLSQTKFRCYLGKTSHPLKQNFVFDAKIRTREILPGPKFALARA